MALASTSQPDFGAGIHRGREAPENAAYDLVNFLIDDEGQPFKRGGSAYYSASNAGQALRAVYGLFMRAPRASRVLAQSTSTPTTLYALNGALAATALDTPDLTLGRPAIFGDLAYFPDGFLYGGHVLYGGSLKASTYSTGTISVAADGTTVTGLGTAWLANVDPGMILETASGTAYGVVRSVTTNTSLELASPWQGGTVAADGYALTPTAHYSADGFTGSTVPSYIATGGRYLLHAQGSRVYFTTEPFKQLGWASTDYHEVPANVTITGMETRGTSVLVFTTGGVWAISGLYLDAIDAYGNIQQTVELVAKDVVLWHDFGIAGWAGNLVIPALDDVYLAGPDLALASITGDAENEKIRRLYRSYVKAGYSPGMATVHRGHYFLPILNGTSLVDVLVCRLDRGAVWTRWAGHAAAVAYAPLVSGNAKLLGVASQRVTDLTGTFDPTGGNATDADATVADATIITRDFATGANQQGFVQRARVRYDLTDGGTPDPAVAIAYSSDADAGVFTTLTEKSEQGGAAGWGVSDGSKYQWALVGKRRERIRFRITQTGAAASFIVRSIELLLRPTGKQ